MALNASYFMKASYVDESAVVANTIFPEVSNYSDARILILMLMAVFMGVVALVYMSGKAPAALAGADFMSSEYALQKDLDERAFRTTYKSSKYGGCCECVGRVQRVQCRHLGSRKRVPRCLPLRPPPALPHHRPLPCRLRAGHHPRGRPLRRRPRAVFR